MELVGIQLDKNRSQRAAFLWHKIRHKFKIYKRAIALIAYPPNMAGF